VFLLKEKLKIKEMRRMQLLARLNEVLLLVLTADNGFRKEKTGQLSKNLVLSGQVEL
jgi:hypothetical protein